MTVRTIQTSFAAGEIAPSLYARVDLDKYHSGAAFLRNFFVDYRGGASTRPGTQFIGRTKANVTGQPRLIPFIISTLAAYVLEFGQDYVRFIANGAYLTDAPTMISAISQANPGVVTDTAHGYSTGNEIQLSSILGMTQLNGTNYFVTVIDANHYSLVDLDGVPVNTTLFSAYISGGQAARVVTVVSPYAAADLPLLKYAQSADVLTLTHPSYPVYNLTQVSTGVFSLAQDVIGPLITPPTVTVTQANHVDLKFLYLYVVTSIGPSGEESLGSYPSGVTGDILNQTSVPPKLNTISWTAVTGAQSYKVYKSGPTATDDGQTSTPPSTVYGFIGQTPTSSFVDNNIAPDFSQSPPNFQDPFSPGQIAGITGSGGSGYVGVLTQLTFTGGGGTGASGYGIVDETTAAVVGVVLTTPGKNYTTVPAISDDQSNNATYTATLGQLNGTYPACVGYFQQRRVFGGTNNLPESFVMSQTGSYNNFDTNPILLDSDAITASIASRQVNVIKSLTAMNTGLIVMTTGGGFLVSGGNQQAAVTPANIVAFPQASSGCNDLPPLVINYDILYAQNRGAVVRDLAFNFYVQSYTGTDRSVLASHLFTGFTLQEWTYAEEPFRLIQVVRDDGVMLNFTYVPEQEIFAWTHYDTNGLYRSVASIPEGQENAVYVVVQRYIGGEWVYYVERFSSRIFNSVEDSWCLDCALSEPLNFPNSSIVLSAGSGNITVTANATLFAAVGDVLWAGGGQAVITGVPSLTTATAIVIKPFPTLANNPLNVPIPYSPGEWSIDTPVTVVSGLDHLEGQTVWAQGDGVPQGPFTVVNGSITLPQPCTKIVVGLPYSCQLQTLKLDLGEPTVQGKRKNIPAMTARLNETLGLSVGPNFTKLTDMKFFGGPYSPGAGLFTGDLRSLITSMWDKEGQICFQQTQPLPATVLGVIPEVVVGDTAK